MRRFLKIQDRQVTKNLQGKRDIVSAKGCTGSSIPFKIKSLQSMFHNITPLIFSVIMRQSLRDALERCTLEQLERKHRRGYERYPVSADEFSVWETEQTWGDK